MKEFSLDKLHGKSVFINVKSKNHTSISNDNDDM